MKKLWCTLFLGLAIIGFSQNPVPFVFGKSNRAFSTSTSTFDLKDFSFSLNLSHKNQNDDYFLTVYNRTTQLNDNYDRVNNTYYLTHHKTFSLYHFDGTKIDSFNPYGASDFGSGVVIGLINLLLSDKF